MSSISATVSDACDALVGRVLYACDALSGLVRDAARAWAGRLAALSFRPDVVVAIDPAAPDARVVADGIGEAMRLVARSGRALRVLLARAPGCRATVRLLSAQCMVEVGVGRDGAPERFFGRSVPAFGLGAARSVVEIDRDDARFEVSPGLSGDLRLRLRWGWGGSRMEAWSSG